MNPLHLGRLRSSQSSRLEDVTIGLGEPIRYFRVPRQQDQRNTILADAEDISSYSWLTAASPSIAVPGAPPTWQDVPDGTQLKFDKGDIVIDQNAHFTPKWPLLALVASVHATKPDFDFAGVDVITTRNSLRKLLRWLRSGGDDGGCREFRIDLDMAGDTLLLTRRELRDRERAMHGVGVSFERASTCVPPGYTKYMGHHRVVKYTLGGLNVLMRFEADACMPGSIDQQPIDTQDESSDLEDEDVVDSLERSLAVMGLLDAMSATDTASNAAESVEITSGPSVAPSEGTIRDDDEDVARSGPGLPGAGPIRVVHSGEVVPTSALVEITTSFIRNVPYWDELADQLFLSGTPRVHMGKYGKGPNMSSATLLFTRKITLRSQELKVAKQKQMWSYRKLPILLNQIHTFVRNHKERRLTLACVNGRLGVYDRKDSYVALPDSYFALFK